MGLISIVAREEFISVVAEMGNGDIEKNGVRISELIPDTAFIVFSGDEEYSRMAAAAADMLVKQGFCLKEIAESIQSSFHNGQFSYEASGRTFEAVLAGYSQYGEAQYHVLSNQKPIESFYPGQGESLYYANGLKPMIFLERSLKMHGMGTIPQAQAAQLHLLREAANLLPDIHNEASTFVLKKIN